MDAIHNASRAKEEEVREIRQGLPRNTFLIISWSVGLFLVCLYMFSRNNDFPIHYHPDESGKVHQILSEHGRRNYNHPMLLLETTGLAVRIFGVSRDPQAVVECGRWVSASFGAMSVVALALCGFLSAGWLGMIAVSVTVGFCPMLLTNAHYMKEDTALILGIALVFLGTNLFHAEVCRERTAAVFLGIAAGIALSSKYVGAIMLIIAGPVLVCGPRGSATSAMLRLAFFLPALVLTWALINYRVLFELSYFGIRFQKEFLHAMTGHGPVALPRPNLFFFWKTFELSQPHISIIAILTILILALTWRKRSGWDIIPFAGLLLWFVALSWNAIPAFRYVLPAVVIMHAIAGLGLAWMASSVRLSWRLRTAIATVALMIVASVQSFRCANYLNQFADDSRQRLRVWVATQLPADAAIVTYSYANLASEGDPGRFRNQPQIKQKVTAAGREYPDMAKLREMGAQFVAFCNTDFERYFTPEIGSSPGREDEFQRRKRGFSDVMEHGTLVWHSVPEPDMKAYTNPEIRVYKVQ